MMSDDQLTAVVWALEHFAHTDKANAAMHLASVRFSPITFRLAEALDEESFRNSSVDEVLSHRHAYTEDPGR
jgi:hypothetical protein